RIIKQIASIYEKHKLYSKAIVFYQCDLQLCGEESLDGIGILTTIANLYRNMENLDKSVALFTKIEETAKSHHWSLELQRARCSLGDIYLHKLCDTPLEDKLERAELFASAL